MKRLSLSSLFLLPIAVLFSLTSQANALSGSQFDAGRIIDDTVFFNGSAMSASQIQNFLNSKVPSCETNHARTSSPNDSGPPYTCLKSYEQNTPARGAESGLCGSLSAKSGRSAAQIIDDVARACGVSQKALIILLQKEQSLITDTWPWDIQYDWATGYGCPDTAECDKTHKGFFNQVYMAARQFKKYARDRDDYNYQGAVTSFVQWHPNSGCGGSNVFMKNQATAGLYNYTPYRPNQAALNNLYGTGNSCSSYGNRNFWRMFNDWFGTTLASPFFRINNSSAIYVLGSDDNYYHVSSSSVLAAYGHSTSSKSISSVGSGYVSGRTLSGTLPPLARFEGNAIYLIDDVRRYHYTSEALLNRHGFSIGDEARLPLWMQSSYSSGGNMQEIVKLRGGDPVFSIENGKKRHISNQAAYDSGSPAYSSKPRVELSSFYLSLLPEGPPILATNILLKKSNNTYGFWNGSQLQPISTQTVAELGLTPDYSASSTSINQLSSSGSTINKLARNSSNQLFLLDSKKKYVIQSSELTNLGLASGDFVSANDNLLSRVPTISMSQVIRINDGSMVYVIKSGERFHAIDRNALGENGFSINQAKSINTTSSALFPLSSKKILSAGTVFRIGSASEIYVISTVNSRLRVPSRNVMSDFGLSFGSVISLSSANIADYSLAGVLNRFVKDSTNQVWLVQNGNIKYPASATLYAPSHYNVSSANILEVSNSILSRYSVGQQLTPVGKSADSPKVYKIENGQKRWITSRGALTSQGYNMSDVVALSASLLDSLPNGPDIN